MLERFIQEIAAQFGVSSLQVGLPASVADMLHQPEVLSLPDLLAGLPAAAQEAAANDTPSPLASGAGPDGQFWALAPIPLEHYPDALLAAIRQAPFDNHDLQILALQAAELLSIPLEHALYKQALNRYRNSMEVLHQVSLGIAANLELLGVLSLIVEAAQQLLPADVSHVYLYNGREPQSLTFGAASWRDGRQTAAVSQPQPDGLVSQAARSGEVQLLQQPAPGVESRIAQGYAGLFATAAAYPLMRGGRILGVFTVAFQHPYSITPEERRLLALLADTASVAIDNAQVTQTLSMRLTEMTTLYRLAQTLGSTLDLDQLLEKLVWALKELVPAFAVSIMLLDEQDTLKVAATAGLPEDILAHSELRAGKGIGGRVVLTGQPVNVPDVRQHTDHLLVDPDLRSLLVVPLSIHGRVIGTLSIDSRKVNAFGPDEERLLTIAAVQAAAAIENARLYTDLQKRLLTLQELDQVRAEFIQNTSHELRTPLTFVRAYVDLLLDESMGSLNEQQIASLQVVRAKTASLVRLVDDITTLESKEEGWLLLEPVDMAALAHIAVRSLQTQAEARDIRMVVESPPDLQKLQGDASRLLQALKHLLNNAMKYSPDQGEVRLSLEQSQEHIMVCVQDQGQGVPATEQERIFDRFYQVDGSPSRRHGGMGLGLAIVKHIVEAHGGRVWVESAPGAGSRFCFILPLKH